MMRTGMPKTASPGGTKPTGTSPSLENEVVLPRSQIVMGEHDWDCALVKEIKASRMKEYIPLRSAIACTRDLPGLLLLRCIDDWMWFRAPGVHSESGFHSYTHAHNNLYAIGGRIKSEFSATVSVVLSITTEI